MKNYILVLYLFVTVISCKKEVKKETNLIDFVPNNPTAVITSSSIEHLQNQLLDAEFLSAFKQTKTHKQVQEKFQFLADIKSDNAIFIGFATVGKAQQFLFATKAKNTDSHFKKTTESLSYNGVAYQKLENEKGFTLTLDSTLVVSSSEILIENLIRNQKDKIKYTDAQFLKLYQANTAETAVFLNAEKLSKFLKAVLPTSFLGSKGWMAVDFESQNGMVFNGITSTTLLPNAFAKKIRNTETDISQVATVLPENTNHFVSYSFEELSDSTSQFEHFSELLSISSEIATFRVGEVELCAFNVINTEVLDQLQEVSTYRNVPVYKNTYYKIPASISKGQPEYACFLGDYMILAKRQNALQNCIAHHQNKTVLGSQLYYKNAKNELLRTAHVEVVSKTKLILNDLSKSLEDESIKKVKVTEYPILAHQITYTDGYAQFNTLLKKIKKQTQSKGITQIADVRLDADLKMQPQWMVNHKTKQKEILVQDVNQVLYLISSKGKILWKKQLNGEIKGKIHQIDIYKNRKLQYAFTTDTEFMVLDRNGKLVAPFHKTFKDGGLLPLSVFDYDKNRNYRFVIAQGKTVLMYDNKMKSVKGFAFKKVKTPLFQSPSHVRIGTKDYVVIVEKSGKIHIVNRQGKERTKVKKQFEMGNNPMLFSKNSIVLVDAKNNVQQINIATGTDKKIAILQSDESRYTLKNNIKVSLEGQNLTINNKTIELDYGTYTTPKIEYVNRNYYISITDLDTQKVFVYTTKGKLLSNFPVYGKSETAITTSAKKILLAVQGEENSVLIYKM